ncbi:MAG: leucine-rich repeat domain-containing protein [Bacillota bacterium]
MKRKIIIFALIFSLLLQVPAYTLGYAIGDDIGDVLSTDIVAQINNCDIPSYNIDNSTGIKASDLNNYGFDVTWDEAKREVHIVRNEYKKLTPIPIEKNTGAAIGSKLGDVLRTDIKTFVGNTLVQAYNMNNSTLILFKDLNAFGTVSWNGQRRIAGLTLNETEVTFEDEIVDKKIRSIINKPEGKIYKSDLAIITYISFFKEDVKSLEGLQYCKNLRYLQADYCKIKDIEILRELKSIEDVRFTGNLIKDISPLRSLKNIKYLLMNENCIEDINPLRLLTKLERLYLDDNAVKDISALKALTSLEFLNLNNNKIQDISALSGLTNIKYLYLRGNDITDISSLENIRGLRSLSLDDNNIECLDAISSAEDLESLYIDNNNIKDIDSLKNLTKLTSLSISDNKIEDISILSNMPEISLLSMDGNRIQDLSVLDQLKKLDFFYCYHTYSLAEAKEILKEAKKIIAKAVKPGMSDYEKELAIHNVLLESVRYDYQNLINDTLPFESYHPYGLLVNKTGVCNAYAHSFKILLNLVGIECIVVVGDTSAGLHAWNIVKLDDEYYYVDPTWNDPPFEYYNKDIINYDYFNITGGQMAKDHEVNNELYPECNGVRYNYKYLKYWSDNNIKPGSYSYLKGKVMLPPQTTAAEGGTKIELIAYTSNNNSDSDDICFTTVVTIPEGENSTEYSIPLIPNKRGYRFEQRIIKNEQSIYGSKYFDEKGTPVKLSRIMMDENDKTIDLQFIKGWSIKGEISFINNEIVEKYGASVFITAQNVEDGKWFNADSPVHANKDDDVSKEKYKYMINLEKKPQKVIIKLAVIYAGSNTQKDFYYAKNGITQNIKEAEVINVSGDITNIDFTISE